MRCGQIDKEAFIKEGGIVAEKVAAGKIGLTLVSNESNVSPSFKLQ